MADTHLNRELDRLNAYVEEYCLAAHEPRISVLQNVLAATPSPHDLSALRDLVGRFERFHEDVPFITAPRGTFTGWLQVGSQFADHQPVTLDDEAAGRHLGLYGASGSGKTTLAHHLVHQAYERGLAILTIDGKADAPYFATTYPETLNLTPLVRIPFLEVPPWLTTQEYTALLLRLIRNVLWGGEGLEQVGSAALQATYAHHERPCIETLHASLGNLLHKGDTYAHRDRVEGLQSRIARFIQRYPGFNTPAGTGLPLDLLCTRSVYFGYAVHTPIEDLIANWLIELRFSYARHHHLRNLHTLALLDESALSIHEETISERATLARTFPLLREFGTTVLLTANNYHGVPDAIRSSLYTQITMNLTDAKESRAIASTFGLNTAQRTYLEKRLTRGAAIVKLADGWKEPLLVRTPHLTLPKRVDPHDWHAAVERTMRLARTAPPVIHVVSSTVQPSRPQVALDTHAAALLRFTAQHGVVLTTEAFRQLALHPQAGTRAKKHLLDVSLIEEERITIHRRRGGTAVALRPTKAGYERADVKRRGTRGGDGVQHEYLVRQLASRIRDAKIDVTIGTKAVDVLVAYNRAHHERLASYLQLSPPDGALIGIEIEVSAPGKTGARNSERNAAVGVSHTVIATMTPLRRTPPGAIVVGVFALLEAL